MLSKVLYIRPMLSADRPPVRRGPAAPADVDDRAADHLRFIRDVVDRSATFTAVPGRGALAMGATAVAAAALAAPYVGTGAWLAVWLGEAVVAGGIGALALARKARHHGVSLRSGAGRKYLFSLLPPLVAGAVLTVALRVAAGSPEGAAPGPTAAGDALLPGLWLLLYGAGTVTGGAFSVRAVPLVGLAFMALGIVALFVPLAAANALLGVGFGGLHLALGAHIVRHHGG